MNQDTTKAIATIGIFVGGAIACAFAPQVADSIIGTCGLVTVLIWMFG